MLPILVRAQYFSIGEEQSRIHWKYMGNHQLMLIFPESMDSAAALWYRELDSAMTTNLIQLGSSSHRLFVILHPNMVESNGMVAWAPSRMELYTTPPQEFSPGQWISILAWHESRHFAQLSSLNRYDSQLIYFLFGEQGIAAVYGLYVPWWFTEGDAVRAETAWLPVGRGRQPSFSMDIVAIAAEGCKYSYDKAILGSYNDYIPNEYTLGYWMTSLGAIWYGDTLWPAVLENIAKNPGDITPFNKLIKQANGKGKQFHYQNTMDSLSNWVCAQNMLRPITIHDTLELNRRRKGYILNTAVASIDSSLYVWSRSMNAEPILMRLSNNSAAQSVLRPGTVLDNDFGFGEKWIVWAETIPHARWALKQKTRLHYFNPETGHHWRPVPIRRSELIFSPDLSDDDKYVVYISLDESSVPKIILADFKGFTIHEYPMSDSLFPTDPVFGPNDLQISFIGNSYHGNGVYVLDLKSGEIKNIIAVNTREIGDLQCFEHQLFFSYSLPGVNEIFSLDSLGNLKQLTCSPYGSFNPIISNDKLFYSFYGLDGLQLASVSLDSLYEVVNDPGFSLYFDIADTNAKLEYQCYERNLLSVNETQTPAIEGGRYRKISHLFRIHSWGPVSTNAMESEINPGLSIMSQNVLGTMTAILSSRYRWSDRVVLTQAEVNYTGFFPRIRLQIETDAGLKNDSGLMSNHNSATFRIDQPLNLSRGVHQRMLRPSLGVAMHKQNYWNMHEKISYLSWDAQIEAYDIWKTNPRNIFPKAGFWMSAGFESTSLNSSPIQGNTNWVDAIAFLPGLFRHDGIRLYWGIENTDTSYLYTNYHILYPRGYEMQNETRFSTLRIDYRMPLLYPDVRIGSLLYLKRIQGGLIFDQSWSKLNGDFRVFGLFAGFDYHVLRFPAPIFTNIYCTYDLSDHSIYAGIGFGVSFYEM